MKVIAIATATLIATTISASAHSTKWLERTQDMQNQQIEQGRYSGELTRREYWQLQAEQARIADMQRAAKADGYISGREYRAIREAQQQAARHIADESRDGQANWFRRLFRRSAY
jgi:hypothetical protein